MIQLLIGLLAGGIFGAGLVVSQMTNPQRILGFLDFFGDWDPRLALVMVGAIVVHAPVIAWVRRRGRPLLDSSLHLPAPIHVDRRLVIGAVLFGVGWGLAGYCPGPALVAALRSPSAFMLTLAMLAGMLVHDLIFKRSPTPESKRASDNLTEPSSEGVESVSGARRDSALVHRAFDPVPAAAAFSDRRS